MRKLMADPFGRAALALPAAAAVILTAAGLDAAVGVRLDLARLCRASYLVVEAECLGSASSFDSEGKRILTFSRFSVKRTFKGLESTEITVATPGGRVGNLVQHVSGSPSFRHGERCILFLWRSRAGHLLPAGLTQGKYRRTVDGKGREIFRADYSGMAFVDAATGMPDLNPKTYAPLEIEAASFRDSIRSMVARQADEEKSRAGKGGK